MHGKLTKIIATIGPASESAEQIEKLILAGVNVFRLNFSHGAKEKHQQVFQTIRQISERMNHPVGILQDLSGPKIRVGNIAGDNLQLDQGDTLVLTSDPSADGTGKRVSINYPKLAQEVKVGEIIYLSDGLIALKIKEIKGPSIYSEVLDGGVLKSKKGVNFPMTKLSISAITDKDRDDLNFGIKLGVDWVALSFVRTAQDIHELRELMKKEGRVAPIIAKIEKPEALENLDQIIAEADGVMVARGDLAVETPMEKVPTVQKQIIKKANFAGKVVVVATQMLESMIIEERPTRAEVTDVASAVFDGVDAVMLSGETAVGKHPVTVVKQMVKILAETEKSAYSNTQPIFYKDSQNVSQAIASAATLMAGAMNAQLMIVPTDSGRTAELMSRHRLEIPILALTTNFGTATRLALRFGVTSTYIPVIDDFEAMLDTAREKALESGLIEKGDYCILTAGHPFNEHGKTNLIKAIQL